MDTDVEVSKEINESIDINDENTTAETIAPKDIKVENEVYNLENFNILRRISSPDEDRHNSGSEPCLSLEVPVIKVDTEFDTYTDDKNQIYKKYKLRERQKTNYRIPTVSDLPKECDYKRVIKTETVKCPQCNQKYETCSELRQHIRNKHKIIYTCSLCKDMFESNTKLIAHKKIHENVNPMYLCHNCQEAFSDHCDFLIHELTHINTKLYTCQECGNIYDKKWSFEIHLMTHFNRPLKCPICSKEVNGEFYLKQHINQHSVNINCVECGLVFKDMRYYKSHMDIHTGIKKFQCLYCGKGFRLNNQRVVHTRIHTQEKKFSCTKCDRKFIQKIDLERHFIKHDAEKKLKCNICSKRFKVKFDLTSHMRTHNKLYDCPLCHKKLSSKGGLKAHLLHKHTTERSEVCNLCNKKFVCKSQLHRHYRTNAHKNNEYKLNIGAEEM